MSKQNDQVEATEKAPIAVEKKEVLPPADKQELEAHESAIRFGNKAHAEIGKALSGIRDKCLYREVGTFEEYCEKTWHFSRAHADRLMKSFQVMEKLSPIGGILPNNEAQVRELARLQKNQWVPTWKDVVKLANGNPLTAEFVKKVVDAKLSGTSEKKAKGAKKAEKPNAGIKPVLDLIEEVSAKVKGGGDAKAVTALLSKIETELKKLKLA